MPTWFQYNHDQKKYFQKGISKDIMHIFQNDFHHEKGQILFLKLGNSASRNQIPHLITNYYTF